MRYAQAFVGPKALGKFCEGEHVLSDNLSQCEGQEDDARTGRIREKERRGVDHPIVWE